MEGTALKKFLISKPLVQRPSLAEELERRVRSATEELRRESYAIILSDWNNWTRGLSADWHEDFGENQGPECRFSGLDGRGRGGVRRMAWRQRTRTPGGGPPRSDDQRKAPPGILTPSDAYIDFPHVQDRRYNDCIPPRLKRPSVTSVRSTTARTYNPSPSGWNDGRASRLTAMVPGNAAECGHPSRTRHSLTTPSHSLGLHHLHLPPRSITSITPLPACKPHTSVRLPCRY